MTSAYDFTATTIEGEALPLARYRGDVLLIVNTASRCGFTPQYRGLEKLHEDYSEQGLRVLGFPCNQFGRQEPDDEAAIRGFCESTYAVRFPMFAKVEVNGPAAHPLFAWLTSQARGLLGSRAVKWNFTKFLVDRAGRPVRRFAPSVAPESLRASIETLLQQPPNN